LALMLSRKGINPSAKKSHAICEQLHQCTPQIKLHQRVKKKQ